jgi:F-type H+-transporting ATPase subunit a
MNISLAPETIFHLGHLELTNSIVSGWLITLFMLVGAFLIRRNLKQIPGRFQAGLELIYSWLYETTVKMVGRADVAKELIPYLLTLFFFIIISNWSGLLPGVGAIGLNEVHHGKEVLVPLFRAPTSDLNMVLVLALFSVGYVQYLGLKYAGFKDYVGRFFNFRDPINFFIGILELIGEFTRIISFAFRLFGNVFAGEVLITVMFYLTTTLLPYVPIIPLPFFVLEILVAVIQAFIFCFLTIVFASLAVASHGSGDHEHGGEEPKKVLHPILQNNP